MFKYTKKVYAEAMVNQGIFRLGTLSEYKNIEKHVSEIGDSDEGKMTTLMEGHIINTDNHESINSPLVKRILESGHFNFGSGKLEIHANMINEHTNDLYIFSASEVLDVSIMKKMNPAYDTCIQIIDTEGFLETLSKCIYSALEIKDGPHTNSCVYVERSQKYSQQNTFHPAFIKSPRFEYQREIRSLWIPKNKPIFPQNIKCAEARKYCKIGNFPTQ